MRERFAAGMKPELSRPCTGPGSRGAVRGRGGRPDACAGLPQSGEFTCRGLLAAAATARSAFAGLLGRGHPDPGPRLEALAADAATELLDAAAQRLGRPAGRLERRGRPVTPASTTLTSR